jgi:DnaJ homolog subfamily C member 28
LTLILFYFFIIELDTAVTTFRAMLRQSWARRALRIITSSTPPDRLPHIIPADIGRIRDKEWESRERSFHDSALDEVNKFVRKYNGLAPYAVRRSYYLKEVEMAKMYEDAVEEIVEALQQRLRNGSLHKSEKEDKVVSEVRWDWGGIPKIFEVFLRWISRVLNRQA